MVGWIRKPVGSHQHAPGGNVHWRLGPGGALSQGRRAVRGQPAARKLAVALQRAGQCGMAGAGRRSEEHTSELQSRLHLVCRLLLEKKKKKTKRTLEVRAIRV